MGATAVPAHRRSQSPVLRAVRQTGLVPRAVQAVPQQVFVCHPDRPVVYTCHARDGMSLREQWTSYRNSLWLLAQYERWGAKLRAAVEALTLLMVPATPLGPISRSHFRSHREQSVSPETRKAPPWRLSCKPGCSRVCRPGGLGRWRCPRALELSGAAEFPCV